MDIKVFIWLILAGIGKLLMFLCAILSVPDRVYTVVCVFTGVMVGMFLISLGVFAAHGIFQ